MRDEPQVIFRFSMETFLFELMNLSSQVCRAWCFKQSFFVCEAFFFLSCRPLGLVLHVHVSLRSALVVWLRDLFAKRRFAT